MMPITGQGYYPVSVSGLLGHPTRIFLAIKGEFTPQALPRNRRPNGQLQGTSGRRLRPLISRSGFQTHADERTQFTWVVYGWEVQCGASLEIKALTGT